MVKRAAPHEWLFWSLALTLGKNYFHLPFWLILGVERDTKLGFIINSCWVRWQQELSCLQIDFFTFFLTPSIFLSLEFKIYSLSCLFFPFFFLSDENAWSSLDLFVDIFCLVYSTYLTNLFSNTFEFLMFLLSHFCPWLNHLIFFHWANIYYLPCAKHYYRHWGYSNE